MKKLHAAAFAYLVLGLVGGLYYRELTRASAFPPGAWTQLSVVHTHLLTLGFLVLLLVLALEKVFVLSRSRLFGWFFWVYNAGVVVTAVMLTVHGTLTVRGAAEVSPAISGIAGLGHMLLSAGLVLLMLALRSALGPRTPATTTTADRHTTD